MRLVLALQFFSGPHVLRPRRVFFRDQIFNTLDEESKQITLIVGLGFG